MTGKEAAEAARAQIFSLRTQLLKEGRTHNVVASTKGPHGAMNIAMKCYANGGENVLHAHAGEDHAFVMLQGQARFVDEQGNVQVLTRHQGILLPAGARYRFETFGDEPAVMLRIGNVYQPITNGSLDPIVSRRIGADGKPLAGDSPENKHVEPVVIEGAWFE